jgi:hypothetical protein
MSSDFLVFILGLAGFDISVNASFAISTFIQITHCILYSAFSAFDLKARDALINAHRSDSDW